MLNALPNESRSGPVESLHAAKPTNVVVKAIANGLKRDIVESSVLSVKWAAPFAASHVVFVSGNTQS